MKSVQPAPPSAVDINVIENAAFSLWATNLTAASGFAGAGQRQPAELLAGWATLENGIRDHFRSLAAVEQTMKEAFSQFYGVQT